MKDTVAKLVDAAPKKKAKRFFCLDCGKDFTQRILSMRNATETQFFQCRGCGRYKAASPAVIALAVLSGRRDEVRNPRGGGI